MKYIIMCGGDYKKWKTPKQLIRINGEPIVAIILYFNSSEYLYCIMIIIGKLWD